MSGDEFSFQNTKECPENRQYLLCFCGIFCTLSLFSEINCSGFTPRKNLPQLTVSILFLFAYHWKPELGFTHLDNFHVSRIYLHFSILAATILICCEMAILLANIFKGPDKLNQSSEIVFNGHFRDIQVCQKLVWKRPRNFHFKMS